MKTYFILPILLLLLQSAMAAAELGEADEAVSKRGCKITACSTNRDTEAIEVSGDAPASGSRTRTK